MKKKKQANENAVDRRPLKKLIAGLIALIILAAIYAGLLWLFNFGGQAKESLDSAEFQMKALSSSMEKVFDMSNSVYLEEEQRHLDKVTLEAASLKALISEGKVTGPALYEDGAVIRIKDGKAELPGDLPDFLDIDPAVMEGESGVFVSVNDSDDMHICNVYYCKAERDLCYIEWADFSEIDDVQSELFNTSKSLAALEKAFGVKLLLFNDNGNDAEGHFLLYASEDLSAGDRMTAEECGITEEMIENALAGASGENGAETGTSVSIDNVLYQVFLRKYRSTAIGGNKILACLTPMDSMIKIATELMAIVAAMFLIIGVFFLVWYCASMRLVRDHSLTERQKKEFGMKAMIRRSVSILAVGCIIIFISSGVLYSLVHMYSAWRKVDTAFSSLSQRISENESQTAYSEEFRKNAYGEFAAQIARIIESQHGETDPAYLQTMCDEIGADYIMVFDSDGNETLSNSRYVGLSLGTDPSSSTYDFRRLLTGTELITHDLAYDEATGEEDVKIGVSFTAPDESGRYGAILLAVPGDKIYETGVESVDDVMSFLSEGGLTAFSVDPESGMVKNAGKQSLLGRTASDLGLPGSALASGYKDITVIDGKQCYISCVEEDGVLYYCATEQSDMYGRAFSYAARSTLHAAVLFAILALILMIGYRKFFEKWSEVGEELKEASDEIRLSGGRGKYSKDPAKRWKRSLDVEDSHAPYRLARLAAGALLVVCVIFIFVSVQSSKSGIGGSLLSFIIRGKWTKGANLFSFTSILILFGEVMVAVIVIRLLLRLISSALGTKGETVCRLLINLTGYAGGLFFVYYTLYYLGFDPGTLLASLGLLSFAVSLGAKDLITDVIAGMSIVFEGEYQVGDIIDVAGYRGQVLEIGVRTTKLEGRGGNIKIISNRDIKNVINMTRMNSWYPLEVSIAGDQPLANVESLLAENLPHIGNAIPEIVSGPFYRGVISMGRGAVTLSIIAECNEGDYYTVQRSLNRAIQELFEEHGIRIM